MPPLNDYVNVSRWARVVELNFLCFHTLELEPCADLEKIFRGGPYLIFFLVDKGIEDTTTAINGPSSARQRNALSMTFRWRANDGQTLNADLVAL